jgi:TonB family protein
MRVGTHNVARIESHLLVVISLCCVALSPVVRSPGYAQRWVMRSPMPEYPIEARAHHITGSGIFVLRVQIKSGRVKEVIVARSSGHAILDEAAAKALRDWQFKPNTLSSIKEILPKRQDPFATEDSFIKVPISFTM